VTIRLSALRSTVIVVVLSTVMLALGVLFTRGGPVQPAAPPSGRSGPEVVATLTGEDLGGTITALQSRLRRLPGDHPAWASLGIAYVQQAAITGDPTYYPKASAALRRSLRVEPDGNAAALTGLAALAAARHDFTEALEYARSAKRINPYGAANQGILTDALQQLGRYAEARKELQRMLNLQPGVSSFTRASYSYELDGQLRPARMALQRALEIATRPSDVAFCLYYLGELAWNSGDLDRAARHYAEGLRQDPSYTPLLAGRAKVAAARGDIDTAVRQYDEVVKRLPLPSYLIAYADLLRSVGRERQATRQEAVLAATNDLFEAQGVNVDLESALFYADRGRPQAAFLAARAVWDRQHSVDAADALAWALHVNGRDRAALRHSEQALRLGTHSALFTYHRGMIERSLGRSGAARESLRDALEINPYFSPLLAPRAKVVLEDLRR